MFSTITFIFILGILILVHEFGHFIIAKRVGVKIEKFSLGFGPKIFSFKKGNTQYTISAIPLGGYIKMAGENPDEELKGHEWEYLSKSPFQRASIVIAGPFLNYLLAFCIFSLIFMLGVPTLTSKVGDVMESYPAQVSGILPGDQIVAIDGEKVFWWEEVAQLIHTNKGEPLSLTLRRGTEEIRISITPKVNEVKNIFGKAEKIGLIGIKPSDEVVKVKYNPFASLFLGANKLFKLSWLTYRTLWSVVSGGVSIKESVTGPIGIYYITQKALEFGFIYLLQILALFSMSLAIFNFLPIPVLDGGHVIFLILEKIRRKSISRKVQETVTQISMFLLIALMIFIFYNDFVRFGLLDKGIQWLSR